MSNQFTASEVRDWERSYKGTGAAKVFGAYADMLEARERAVPVYQHRNKNGPMRQWFDCSEETFMAMEHNEHDREHFDRRVLYTHPISADAERLAEALRELVVACEEHDAMVSRIIGHPAGWNAQYLNSARQALVAHSTQAQPPAASVTDAMVMRLKRALPLFCADVTMADARAALEAVLAAQENPNG